MKFLATLDKRRVFTTCGVLAIAFLCGHLMQSLGDNPLVRIENSSVRSLPDDPEATVLPRPPVVQGRVKTSSVRQMETVSKAQTTCVPQLKLRRAPGAIIDLDFDGCTKGTVVLRQGELEIATQTDTSGRLNRQLPAFDAKTTIALEFGDETITATLEVPEAADYQHVAILWEGEQALSMHAFEFGAKRNQFGHVWSGAPKSPKRAIRGSGGFLTRLGDGTGKSAEIYSFPAEQSRNKGVVRLLVEAEVTPANCGKQVDAVALQSGPLGGLDTTEVALKMPQCDGVGQVLRLQNLFQDMRLAGR